jgi:peptidoglycan/LPS O-acetylase OafA/YrhL
MISLLCPTAFVSRKNLSKQVIQMQFTVAPPGPARTTTRQIVGVDAIRCFAAIMVMVFHLSYWIWAGTAYHPGLGATSLDYAWLAPFTSSGWIGVQVFFVISGFVILYSSDGTTPYEFFRSRFLRLVPAAWICASITAAVLLLSGTGYGSVGQLAKSWLKTVIFYPFPGWIDNAYWTLGIELGFYFIVFAVIACGMFRRIFQVIGLFGLVSSLFWIVSFAAENTLGSIDRLAFTPIFRVTDLLLLQHGCFFALGAFLCLARIRRLSGLELGCLLVFVTGGMIEIRFVAHLADILTGIQQSAVVPLLIWLVCVAAIVASIRWNYILAGFDRRFVAVMRAIGLLTYPLYLIHQFVGYIIINTMRQFVGDTAALVIAITACLGLALVVSRYLEPSVRSVLATSLARFHSGGIVLIQRIWRGSPNVQHGPHATTTRTY